MTKAKTKVARSVGAAIAQNATPADHVMAAANISGAKSGKDAVAAQVDWTAELTAIANDERDTIAQQVALVGSRMEQWQRVAKIGASNPKVFGAYPNILRRALLIHAGLVPGADGAFPERNLWDAGVSSFYDKVLSKRLSETKKAMLNLTHRYTETVKTLTGKGTIQQKLVALPNLNAKGEEVTGKGRPKGSASATKGKKDLAKGGQADTLKQIGVMLDGLSFNVITGDVMSMILAHAKQRKEYAQSTAAQSFVNGLVAMREKFFTASASEAKAA